VDVAAWTPFGAVWSIPGRIALGDIAGAIGATAVALGTLGGLLVVWRLMVGASLRSRGDGAARQLAAGRLGVLGWMPSTPVGAVTARSLIYWFRDTRQAKQLILIPVLPALMLLSWQLFRIDGIAVAIGPIVATILPLSVFAGLSFDGTAFAAQLAAGVRGIDDRVGRAIALLVITVPAAIIVQVVVAVVIGRLGELPALLGLTLGALLASLGVVSVSSARVVVPVARAGQSPFSAQAGAATVSITASYAVTGITGALAFPSAALAVTALVLGNPLLGWLALAAALVLGTAIAWGGVVLGGRILDSSGAALLARLRLIRN
ncbi:MAG TPA: transporter, partial [Pseudolysinimonas sp.]|nr:transporter [Pseudolysinimonas sp.]